MRLGVDERSSDHGDDLVQVFDGALAASPLEAAQERGQSLEHRLQRRLVGLLLEGDAGQEPGVLGRELGFGAHQLIDELFVGHGVGSVSAETGRGPRRGPAPGATWAA